MFVAGGQVFGAADQFIDLVDVYDFSNKQWSTLKLPTGRSYMTVIGANKNVYFAGGRSDEEDITDIVDIYSLVPISSTETEQTYRLSIFPNPVEGEIILQLPDVSPSDVVQYQIYTSTGVLLLKGQLNSSYKIDAHNLIKGNYFIKAFNQQMDRTYVVPFIKI